MSSFFRKEGDPPYVPPGGMPRVEPPSAGIFKAMGEENIFKMTADFYAGLEQSSIRGMFPEDMQEASKKLGAFLVFRLGGPPLYQDRHGEPRLRARHMPFRIDESARQIWLACFKKILENADVKYRLPMEHMPGFWKFLEDFSAWMVNTEKAV